MNLKGIAYEPRTVHLARGEQHGTAYRTVNPQGLVPVLMHGDSVLTQSLAILEYLDEVFPDPPILPPQPERRARARALAEIVACDVHPLDNLRVLHFLEEELCQGPEARGRWYRHWIQAGFQAFEAMLAADPASGPYCLGATPTIADLCLIPQIYNARRYDCELGEFPRILAVETHCLTLAPFRQASPEAQPDAGPEFPLGPPV